MILVPTAPAPPVLRVVGVVTVDGDGVLAVWDLGALWEAHRELFPSSGGVRGGLVGRLG